MFRSIGIILAGLLSAVIVIFILEMASAKMYPIPSDLDPTNLHDLGIWIDSLPITALMIVIIGWFLGSFIGSLVIASYQTEQILKNQLVFLVLLTGTTMLNLYSIPHPQWMWIIGIASIFFGVGCAYLFSKLIYKQNLTNWL